jgi:hypothetical protein
MRLRPPRFPENLHMKEARFSALSNDRLYFSLLHGRSLLFIVVRG